MTDPFDRSSRRPVDAGRPRPRLRRCTPRPPAPRPAAEPAGPRPRNPSPGGPPMSQLIPYLVVRDARAALDWYADAFGAHTVGDPYHGRRPGRARRARGRRRDALPRRRLPRARPRPAPDDGKVAVSLHLSVPDVDAVGRRGPEAVGATVERPATDAPYGRTGVHRRPLRPPLDAADAGPGAHGRPAPGDAVYLTLQVPDGARARDFYEAVLGWSAVPGRVPDGWQVEGTTPMIGIGGGTSEPGTVPMYAVDDIEVAVAAVRTAGGRPGEIERQSYGLTGAVPRRPGPAVLPGSAGLRARRAAPAGRRPARPRGRRCPGSRPLRSSSTSSRSRRTCRRR